MARPTKTTEQFIADARKIHGDKYDYSKVVYIHSLKKVCIICPKHGEFWQIPSAHLQKEGCKRCHMVQDEYGKLDVIGDIGTDCYIKWRHLLKRCFDQEYKQKNPTYADVSVCNEWLLYSNFKKWFYDPHNAYQKSYQLDKDLLVKNNKLYSPETCCFIPQEINKLLTKRDTCRGQYPLGVTKAPNRPAFAAHITKNGKHVYLGYFKSIDKAFNAYKQAKEQYFKELANKYFQEGKITEKVYNALMRYEVEITD